MWFRVCIVFFMLYLRLVFLSFKYILNYSKMEGDCICIYIDFVLWFWGEIGLCSEGKLVDSW